MRVSLQLAGLGERELIIPMNAPASTVHEIILKAFPALEKTGYELMRTTGYGKREFERIGDVCGADVLRAALGQAKCYIRPLISAIDLTPVKKEHDKSKSVRV